MPVVYLDWRRHQVSARLAACRYRCGGRTYLRDEDGKPAHKTCAEAALAATRPAAATKDRRKLL
ncbi:hypothetical protein CSH63_33015 [Micromonospora tulbaghiae]|uniref:Uncharacterized protein n=1 Tax=Micromonospora tulbaghiae TaxID=479978 RepID=A0A386WUM5_9ACTN|nr:hypothetical protein CSH63_27330 [Micromonospora tulbaghiae]AYF32177.1 hypothetical protein CSH63_33015 [Micromonospora tulbaghiae]